MATQNPKAGDKASTSTKTDTTGDMGADQTLEKGGSGDTSKAGREPTLRERPNTRGDRGNGGGADEAAKSGMRSGIADRSPSEDTGDREAVSPGSVDKIWTNDSKDRWEDGQPDLTDQLKSMDKLAAKRRKKEEG